MQEVAQQLLLSTDAQDVLGMDRAVDQRLAGLDLVPLVDAQVFALGNGVLLLLNDSPVLI